MSRSSLPALLHRHAVAFGLGLFILALYIYSLCPDVYLIDSGELAAVSYTLGIAHPTGYPLYTLISYFFAHLPGEPIRNLNLLSALFSVCAAVFLFMIARQITRDALIPLLAVSLFAFAPIIWRVSVTNEVYPLTGLLIVILIYLLNNMKDDRAFYLAMYLIGLSFTNHMMVFSLALPLLVYVIVVHRPGRRAISLGLVFLALGLSLYLYVMARTSGGARLAWGNAENLQRLYWHVSGKQYQVWMFSASITQVLKNLIDGLRLLAGNLLYVFAAPSLLGFLVLYRQHRGQFWLLLAVITANLLYAVNYSIPDIESYYIPSFIMLTVSLTYGLRMLGKYAKPFLIIAAALAIPIVNYNSCTLRNNHFGMDFGRAHIASLPDSSLLITTYWDIYSPLMYLRQVRQERRDLVIIDKELLRRTWYLQYLEREYPRFYARIRMPVEAYLVELRKFEYGRPYQPQVIQARYIDMLNSFVDAKLDKGVFFASPWPDDDLNQVRPHYPRTPFGLVHVITQESRAAPFDFSRLELNRPPVVNDARLQYNLGIVRARFIDNIRYLQTIGNHEQAAKAREILESL
ncbi:DUF2723 domain-containing protein [candidate division WOR-3 bacterium]|nr:DUF2723 domain-containing protein [candidate division WOR-3 bacterium]